MTTATRRMKKHWVFFPPSAETVALKLHRSCHTWTGAPKRRLTPSEAETVVERMNHQAGRENDAPVESYACPLCGWMHVGRMSLRGAGRLDEVVILESGERVASCARMENTGSERARLEALAQRLRAAEKRRLVSAPSPKRTTPLP